LCKGISSSFISIQTGGFDDFAGVALTAVALSNGRPLTGTYNADTTAPEIDSYSLNMDTGILSITFSDVIQVSSLSASGKIGLQATSTGGTRYDLTGGSTTSAVGYVVDLAITTTDLNKLKFIVGLADDDTTTYLVVASEFIKSVANVNVAALVSDNALLVSSFVADQSAPTLEDFNLNEELGVLTLFFNEPVLLSSVSPVAVTLQGSAQSVANNLVGDCQDACDASSLADIAICKGACALELTYSVCEAMCWSAGSADIDDTYSCIGGCGFYQNVFATNSFTLTGGNSARDATGLIVDITLTASDLAAIKLRTSIGKTAATVFISATSALATDMVGIAMTAVADGSAFAAQSFIADSDAPSVSAFDLDMNLGRVVLTFDENVQASSISLGSLTLASNQLNSNPVSLAGGFVSTANGLIVTVYLTTSVMNAIRAIPALGRATTSSFIYFDNSLADDMTGVSNNAIAALSALGATGYTTDTTVPTLVSFDLNMKTGHIALTFSEIVKADQLDVTKITIHNFDSSATVMIGTSTTSSSNGLTIVIVISADDLNTLKGNRQTATSDMDTYISLGSGAIKDMFSNLLSTATRVAVTTFTADDVAPTLLEYSLNMNLGKLSLTFSEIVNVQTLQPTYFALQHVMSSPMASLKYTLTGGTANPSVNGVTVTIDLSVTDLDEIKSRYGLAVSKATTYLSFSADAIKDMNTNGIVAVDSDNAVLAQAWTADSTAPTLVSFALDMSLRKLTISFSETMQLTSYAPECRQLGHRVCAACRWREVYNQRTAADHHADQE
jgi:hypothetical protein